MIQPAAPSVSSGLALTTGAPSPQGDDAAVSGGFSALLSSTLATGKDRADDAAATQGQAVALPARQDGTESGKMLPPGLPDADAVLAQLACADTAALQGAASAPAAARALPAAPTKIILPGLALPVAGKLAQATKPAETPPPADRSAAESLVLATAAQLVRSPGADGEAAAKPGKAAPAKADKVEADAGSDEPAPRPDLPQIPATSTPPAVVVVPVPVAATAQPTVAISAKQPEPAGTRAPRRQPQANTGMPAKIAEAPAQPQANAATTQVARSQPRAIEAAASAPMVTTAAARNADTTVGIAAKVVTKPARPAARQSDEALALDLPAPAATSTAPTPVMPVAVSAQPTSKVVAKQPEPAETGAAARQPQAVTAVPTELVETPQLPQADAVNAPAGSSRQTAAEAAANAPIVTTTAPRNGDMAIGIAAEVTIQPTDPATRRPVAVTVNAAPQAVDNGQSSATVITPVTADQANHAPPASDEAARKAIDALSRPAPKPLHTTAIPQNDSASATVKLTADVGEAQLQAPLASTPQPTPAVQDAPSLVRTADPVITAPAATPVHQAGHDFATLVDRLVEARDAAVPQAVHASVSHSEFGQVSLRFDQDAGGLSVAMSSADPDFARAVQASASSAGTQTASDNGQNSPRQDAPRQDAQAQQQAAGSFSNQSQPQSHSQASARNDRSAPAQNDTRAGEPGEQGQDARAADPHSGIYA
jgi:hypothetical protein